MTSSLGTLTPEKDISAVSEAQTPKLILRLSRLKTFGSVIAAPVMAFHRTKRVGHFPYCSTVPKRKIISELNFAEIENKLILGSTRQNFLSDETILKEL
jgi:hypothetical protein